jgi:hypothetical protein
MLTTTAPMIGSVRSGDAPGESSWDRQDYRDRNHLRSRFDRRYQDVARRGLKRRERAEVAHLVASYFDDAALDATEAANLAAIMAMYADEAECPGCDMCGHDVDEAILDDFGVETFAELAAIVAGEVAQAAEIGDDDLTELGIPTWGDTFDPADVQWGFSVRNRP